MGTIFIVRNAVAELLEYYEKSDFLLHMRSVRNLNATNLKP